MGFLTQKHQKRVPETEHDLLQNVMERVCLLLPPQGCSIQFLIEEMKLPPLILPLNLFYAPCTSTPLSTMEFGDFTIPCKCH